MRRRTPLAVIVGLLLLAAIGCGNSSGEVGEASVACESLCDRLYECEVDFSADPSASQDPDFTEFDCEAICGDMAKLEPQVLSSCQRATATMLECTESLTCDELGGMDFRIVGKVMTLNPLWFPPTFGDDDLPSSFPLNYWDPEWIPAVQVPPNILFDLNCRPPFTPVTSEEAQLCPINSKCMIDPSNPNPGVFSRFNICRVDRFDVLTLYTTGLGAPAPCLDEYNDMITTCDDGIHF